MLIKFAKSLLINLIDWIYLNTYNLYIFGKKKNIEEGSYKDLFLKIKDKKYQAIEDLEQKTGYMIEKKWLEDLALVTQIVKKKSELNYAHGRAIYAILSRYIDQRKKNHNAFTILETGTARGFSAICMSKALNDLDANGKIITVDVIGHSKKIYWNCIADENGPKKRSELLSPWQDELDNIIFIQGRSSVVLKTMGINRINFAFLDGQHDKKSILDEYTYLENRQKQGDIIFFDDVTPGKFSELYNFVKKIENLKIYSIEFIEISIERSYAIATRN